MFPRPERPAVMRSESGWSEAEYLRKVDAGDGQLERLCPGCEDDPLVAFQVDLSRPQVPDITSFLALSILVISEKIRISISYRFVSASGVVTIRSDLFGMIPPI